ALRLTLHCIVFPYTTLFRSEEADPDSVLDALDAMLRRLNQVGMAPELTLETEEGDRWLLSGGGSRVYGDRENLALRLSRGEEGDLEFERPTPALPVGLAFYQMTSQSSAPCSSGLEAARCSLIYYLCEGKHVHTTT